MPLNADFSQRVIIRPADRLWVPSPMVGVERCMLDRIGAELARATSIVRYAAGSRFSAHVHPGGEEFLVLEGVFSDERGDYPAGTYVRNPIGSQHAPFSRGGCSLFVKLMQFASDDQGELVVDSHAATWLAGAEPGLQVLPLHRHGREQVALERWAPGTRVSRQWGGEEVLVLDGTFQDEFGDYPAGSWLRDPQLAAHSPCSDEGCLLWVKSGHLPA